MSEPREPETQSPERDAEVPMERVAPVGAWLAFLGRTLMPAREAGG